LTDEFTIRAGGTLIFTVILYPLCLAKNFAVLTHFMILGLFSIFYMLFLFLVEVPTFY
jgi:amino acid permease